jgi:hypothetical protein
MSEQDYDPIQDDAPQTPHSRAVMGAVLAFVALLVLIAGFDLLRG